MEVQKDKVESDKLVLDCDNVKHQEDNDDFS